MSYKTGEKVQDKKKIVLDIDYREQNIIAILKERASTINIQINVKNLLIGDYMFTESNVEEDGISNVEEDSISNQNAKMNVHYIIERKTINDLCSSIKDGRFLEQKNRLNDTIDDPSKIIYIIEGDKSKISSIYNLPKSTINSAIQNLIFKHKYKVIFTDSLEETVDHILILYKKLVNNEFISKGAIIKPIKRVDKLNENLFINMLCAIPGISIKTALVISYKYKNMNELIRAYDMIPDYDSKCSLLSNIVISEKRKIGIALSTKVYKSLFEITICLHKNSSKKEGIKNSKQFTTSSNCVSPNDILSINKETCLL